MLKIWGRNNSVNVQKVLWCCEEMGVKYERIDAGMIAADSTSFSSLGSILTRGLGAGLVVEPSVACHPLAGGDRFMLCSDGLSDLVDDAVIGRILGEAPTLDAAADLLVARAIEEGGTDNVSLILMQPLATGGR